MSIDTSLERRASLHAALGEPSRLAIVDALLLGDDSPGALASRLGLATNLLAHHVNVLESVGLVRRVRSEADRRRSYLHLERTHLAGLAPSPTLAVPRVLFVCTHNSARSQLAAALWRESNRVPAASAGTHPAERVHPRAVAAAGRHPLRLRGSRPTAVDLVLRETDLVVTVCDSAREELAEDLLPRPVPPLHWSIPDPAATDTDQAFEDAFLAVDARVRTLASAVAPP